MVSFVLPDIRRFVLDAIDVIYGDADDAQIMMASDFNVRPDTVRQWVHGRRSPPRAVILKLQEMVTDLQARADSYKKRLRDGLPNMLCPICGSDFVVHHHQRGRTVQCLRTADHIFEPEEGAPFGSDTPKRFVLVPGGLATIEQRSVETEWQPMSTAPKNGTPIRYRRVIDGKTLFEGVTMWREDVPVPPAPGADGEEIAPATTITGWMYPDLPKRTPGPTHWKPAS